MEANQIDLKLKSLKTWNCSIDLNEIKLELNKLFKSSNPLSLYLKASEVREKFSAFLSCLSDKIVEGFDIREWEKNLITYIYKLSSYDKVWNSLTFRYLEESKNFNRELYDLYLEKIKNNENKNFYDSLEIISHLMKINLINWKKKRVFDFVSLDIFESEKLKVDDLIEKYNIYRKDFLEILDETLKSLTQDDKKIFNSYVQLRLIDIHFSDLKLIFYSHSAKHFLDKKDWTTIHAKLKVPETSSELSKYLNEQIVELLELKEMILDLNNNLFSSFILPVVYNVLAEKVSIPKHDLNKMKYILLNILASNYWEYKQIYMFFNQLEVFLNYEQKINNLEKLKVSFSIVMFSFLILIVSYFYLPIWIFVWMLLLMFIKYSEIMYPEKYFMGKWNIWFRFFSILFLTVSGYFWMQNLDDIKSDTQFFN